LNTTLYVSGIALVLTGIAVMAISLLILALRSKTKGKIKGSGVIMIGPFPIVLGTDIESTQKILLFSIILTILAMIAMIAIYLLSK